MTNILIVGASRGLGAAFSAGVPDPDDTVWLVSRTRPELEREDGVARHWIEADLTSNDASRRISDGLLGQPLDVLIYNAGIWERDGFTPDYSFERVDDAETERIVAINLTSAIACVRAVLPNLRRGATRRSS
jgi:short-subunit dehydrogenase